MPRLRTGCVQKRGKKHVARISWKDSSTGRRVEKSESYNTATEANTARKRMLKEADDGCEEIMSAARMTFNQLADYYQRHYLIPAEYVEDRKIAGYRHPEKMKWAMDSLRTHFGHSRIQKITWARIREYKLTRLKTKTIRKGQRSITTVNRELALLRRMFSVAEKERWLSINPFKSGESLISAADEKKRERVLSREEERRLLAACVNEKAHIRPIVICAMDTGMRAGEIYKLLWRDVDLSARKIFIVAMNTKALKSREVPISQRLLMELTAIFQERSPKPSDSVFNFKRVDRAFRSACVAAGLTGFRFHDLRHTAATRLVQGGMPIPELARLLGHSVINTTFRYVNADDTTVVRAAEILDRLNSEPPGPVQQSEAVH